MSIPAEIVVLFNESRDVVDPVGLLCLSMIEDADSHCWVSPEGELEYRADQRIAPLLGDPSLEGRLWLGTLGRHWSPDSGDYGGDPVRYADTIRSLVKQQGVQYVWYGMLTEDGGCRGVPAVTSEWIGSFFGATLGVTT